MTSARLKLHACVCVQPYASGSWVRMRVQSPVYVLSPCLCIQLLYCLYAQVHATRCASDLDPFLPVSMRLRSRLGRVGAEPPPKATKLGHHHVACGHRHVACGHRHVACGHRRRVAIAVWHVVIAVWHVVIAMSRVAIAM